MRVLVAHNEYRSENPSGENLAVADEIAQLREAGIEVSHLRKSSDAIRGRASALQAAAGPVYSPAGVRQFRELLRQAPPDVVHVHNVYPLISPWVVRIAQEAGIPVVQTIHNFRHDCVAGSYFRDGATCFDCAGRRWASPAIQHGCYRGSHLQSIPMVVGRSVHRSTWLGVNRFLALTSYHADYLKGLGARPDQITLRPTAVADPGVTSPPGTDLLFVGRLDVEKGVEVLLEAWQRTSRSSGRKLHIAGTGPLEPLVRTRALDDPSLVFHGAVSAPAVQELMRSSGALVIPSIWPEGLPRVLVEAFSHGRAVCVSDHGGLAATVDPSLGWLVAPGSTAELAATLDEMTGAELARRGTAARESYERRYTPEIALETLLRVYDEVTVRR